MTRQVWTRAMLAEAGISDRAVRTRLRHGGLVRIARGTYMTREDVDALDPVGVHLARARLVGSRLDVDEALSHVTAAVVHGLDVWDAPLRRIHVTRPPTRSCRVSDDLHIHTSDLDGDVVDVDGLRVTSLARTVVDVARTLTRPRALVIGDAALRAEPTAHLDLPRILAACRGRTGIVAAESVARLIDGRSESVGESLSRLHMIEAGLPMPDLQHEIVVRDGRRYRVDFLWRELGIVGEFDGAGKYTERHDLLAEKEREDALRDLGLEVIRWNWAELSRFHVVVDRFERARRRQQARRAALERETVIGARYNPLR
ncbi:type IV toxin-antitoxin system AbiEi family antitoxin domain-containing protein [Rhodococcus pyridinivorans]|uniref:type IV toxin-antitoxin system AbiEi family antitoxin domain-containing protein n=1 Tax=Rhodococcus pyridinivorans TaxID=103816 RepID=UPI00110F672A|nr:type IV toxin-antitoxin system AbiEi family antitoxin domain-containing protein [Rhodococcus pyridinivorans]